MRNRAHLPFAMLVVGLLLAAAPALAQTTPTQQVYGPQNQVQSVVGGPTDVIPPPSVPGPVPGPEEADDVVPAAPAEAPSTPVERGASVPVTEGKLPFTGFEAGLVAIAGAFLLAMGFAMRRVARTTA